MYYYNSSQILKIEVKVCHIDILLKINGHFYCLVIFDFISKLVYNVP